MVHSTNQTVERPLFEGLLELVLSTLPGQSTRVVGDFLKNTNLPLTPGELDKLSAAWDDQWEGMGKDYLGVPSALARKKIAQKQKK